jgi:hypothetical protein
MARSDHRDAVTMSDRPAYRPVPPPRARLHVNAANAEQRDERRDEYGRRRASLKVTAREPIR